MSLSTWLFEFSHSDSLFESRLASLFLYRSRTFIFSPDNLLPFLFYTILFPVGLLIRLLLEPSGLAIWHGFA